MGTREEREMNLVATDSKEKFNERLAAEIESRLDPELVGPVKAFANRYFHSVPLEEIAGLQVSDLYGAIFGWWTYIQGRKPDEVKIATFNPTLEEEGWLSGRTEITILHRDMPFLVDSIRIELNRRRINIYKIHSVVLFVIRDDRGRLLEILPDKPEDGAMVSREAATSARDPSLGSGDALRLLRPVREHARCPRLWRGAAQQRRGHHHGYDACRCIGCIRPAQAHISAHRCDGPAGCALPECPDLCA